MLKKNKIIHEVVNNQRWEESLLTNKMLQIMVDLSKK